MKEVGANGQEDILVDEDADNGTEEDEQAPEDLVRHGPIRVQDLHDGNEVEDEDD